MTNLAKNYPHLLEEWDYKKNEKAGIYPDKIHCGSEKKVWWICKKCNYEWNAMIYSRSKTGTGCPVCGHRIVVEGRNDLKTLYPHLMKEWDYKKNNELGLYPEKIAHRSDKKAWWICPICNNQYISAIKSRTRGNNCPKCGKEMHTSYQEQTIYYYLKKSFKDTSNRWDYIGYEIDVFVPSLSLGIEYDGQYYHNTSSSLEKEKNKYNYLKGLGIKLIRIREENLVDSKYCDYCINLDNNASDSSLENVIKKILNIIQDLFGDIDIDYDINIQRDRPYIYEQYIYSRKNNSLVEKYKKTEEEWDYEKNKISPYSVTIGSEKKVWWKCSKGHPSYEQQIRSHVLGQSCPYCAGQKLLSGFNDLETKFPNIAKEWDNEKNEEKPSEVMGGSDKKVWWICPKGHNYYASISHRTGKDSRGCPVCVNKKVLIGYNDLKTLYPHLVDEWDYEKNTIKPEEITPGSLKKVWWICPKGHSYDAQLRSRTILGTKCPVCNGKRVLEGFNDFYSQKTDLMKEWHTEKNDKLYLYPNKLHQNSYKKVWWKCSICNHEWKTCIEARSRGTGCPKCSLKKNKRKKQNTQV